MKGGLFIFCGLMFLARSCVGIVVPGFEQYGDITCEKIYEGGYANQLLFASGNAADAKSKATAQCVLKMQYNIPQGSNGINFAQCVQSSGCNQNQNSGSCDDNNEYNYDNEQNLEDYLYNDEDIEIVNGTENTISWNSNEATFLSQDEFESIFQDSCNCTLEILPYCQLTYQQSLNGSTPNSEFPIVTSNTIPTCHINLNDGFSCSKSSNYYCSLQAQPKVTYMQGETQKDYAFFVQDSTYTCQLTRLRPYKTNANTNFYLSAYYVFNPVSLCYNWNYPSPESIISSAYQGLFLGNGSNCYGGCLSNGTLYTYTVYCSISQSGMTSAILSDSGTMYLLIQQWHQTVLQKITQIPNINNNGLSAANYNLNLNLEIGKIFPPTTQSK